MHLSAFVCTFGYMAGRTKRHNQIKLGAIKYDVATMDRTNNLTIYITCVISVLFSNDMEAYKRLRDSIHHSINTWLDGQDVWNRKMKIFVFEMPEENKQYDGSFRNVDFELHLRRNTPGTSYTQNAELVMPLVDALTETIKKTCSETGLVLTYRPSNNKPGMKLKDYVEKLALDDTTTVASEPDAG